MFLARLDKLGALGDGDRWAARVERAARAVLKLIPLIVFVGVGMLHIESANSTRFAPKGYDALGATTVFTFCADTSICRRCGRNP